MKFAQNAVEKLKLKSMVDKVQADKIDQRKRETY